MTPHSPAESLSTAPETTAPEPTTPGAPSRRSVLSQAGLALGAASVPGLPVALLAGLGLSAEPVEAQVPATRVTLPSPECIALHRMAFGPRPGDIERVRRMGLSAYIEEQLRPDETDPGSDPKIAAARLAIEYPAGNDNNKPYPAVKEDRPLTALTKAPAELLKLFDGTAAAPWAEKVRPRDEVRVATWLRATYGQWQLREVMADFWHNHFSVNTDVDDDRVRVMLPIYDRDVIRKHALGNFREFLGSVARSACMLVYLNGHTSKASPANENFARELFELHTLGRMHYLNDKYHRWRDVPGATDGKPIGYIDQDVYEAARAFTGWTLGDGRDDWRGGKFPRTGEFYYHAAWHDPYQKRVLGKELDANAPPMKDGEQVLDVVARHPGTAVFLATKLCQRLVADNPPASLVARAAEAWRKHVDAPDQIARVLRVILTSDEFKRTWGQKVKRPFEATVAWFRAVEADVTPNQALVWMTQNMGQALFNWPMPTGYPDTTEHWASTAGLMGRYNLPLAVMWDGGKVARWPALMPRPAGVADWDQLARFWELRMLGRPLDDAKHAAIVAYLRKDQGETPPLDNPDFAHRVKSTASLLAMLPDFHQR